MIREINFKLEANKTTSDLDQYIQAHPVKYTQKRKFERTVMK